MKETVIKILKVHFGYKGDTDWGAIHDTPLTAKDFSFDGIQLYYFLMCLEEEFHIYFEADDFANMSFFTLDNVVDAVHNKFSLH